MKNEPRTVVGRNQEEEGECVACGLGEPHDHEDDELCLRALSINRDMIGGRMFGVRVWWRTSSHTDTSLRQRGDIGLLNRRDTMMEKFQGLCAANNGAPQLR
ncbi:hypothetical protein WN943_013706 [Citrus x changshan-huyou]